MSAALTIHLLSRKGKTIQVHTLPGQTVVDVKKSIASNIPGLSVERQKLSKHGDRTALKDSDKLSDLNQPEFDVKDLGPQVAWKTVFLVEYFGPLVVHPLIYHYPKIFYGQDVEHSAFQKYIYWFVIGHFVKRELETLFVHRFSHGTMPFFNIFKNSFHYHILSGLFLAYDIYRPVYSASSSFIKGTFRDDPNVLMAIAAALFFFELSNGITHLTLRNLRPEGTTKRAIPYGYGFSLVSCPNYFFETCAWGLVCIVSGSYASYLFWVAAVYQMAVWAVKKHKQYKKEFGKEYPRNRKAMFPFIL